MNKTQSINKPINNPINNHANKPFDYWLKKNKYYHKKLIEFFKFAVQENSRVLVINCKNGYLLDALKPSFGVGIDDDQEALGVARSRYPNYEFFSSLGEINQTCNTGAKFDYIILPSVTMETDDIQTLFEQLSKFCDNNTRIIIDTYSYFWEPILKIARFSLCVFYFYKKLRK